MQYTDEQIRNMVQLKETIIEKLSKYEEEIAFLQKTLDILDVSLKDSSFTKASDLPKNYSPKNIDTEKLEESDKTIPIKKSKDGEIIANAIVTPGQVSIVLKDGIGLTPEIPPLRTFFVERIIGEMKKNDDRLVEEAGDVLLMIELMINRGLISKEDIDARKKIKLEKLKKWSNLINE